MTAESCIVQDNEMIDWTADAAYSAGAVIQLRDGRAGIVSVEVASGRKVGVWVCGIHRIAKTASMVMLIGSRLFWDFSANKAHLLHGNDRDFYIGTAMSDAAANDTTVLVALNSKALNEHSLASGYASVPVYTAGLNLGAFGTGEGVNLIKDATNEAQKVDALSYRALALAALPIVDALVCVNSDGNAASDTNVGVANGTHATDADSITEHLFVHLDGGSTAIKLQSKDGTTTVAATDTTLTYTAGTPFLVQFDMRNTADIQVYINGANVLPDSVFRLDNATGPLKLLAHSEKSGTATAGNVSVPSLVVRPAQV